MDPDSSEGTLDRPRGQRSSVGHLTQMVLNLMPALRKEPGRAVELSSREDVRSQIEAYETGIRELRAQLKAFLEPLINKATAGKIDHCEKISSSKPNELQNTFSTDRAKSAIGEGREAGAPAPERDRAGGTSPPTESAANPSGNGGQRKDRKDTPGEDIPANPNGTGTKVPVAAYGYCTPSNSNKLQDRISTDRAKSAIGEGREAGAPAPERDRAGRASPKASAASKRQRGPEEGAEGQSWRGSSCQLRCRCRRIAGRDQPGAAGHAQVRPRGPACGRDPHPDLPLSCPNCTVAQMCAALHAKGPIAKTKHNPTGFLIAAARWRGGPRPARGIK